MVDKDIEPTAGPSQRTLNGGEVAEWLPPGKNFSKVWLGFEMSRKPVSVGKKNMRHNARCRFCKTVLSGKAEVLQRHIQNCEEIPGDIREELLAKIEKPGTKAAINFLSK